MTSTPRLVSRTVGLRTRAPSSVTVPASSPAGSVAPMRRSLTFEASTVTVVVYLLPRRSARTSALPLPSRIALAPIRVWPSGSCGTISSLPVPSDGRTPSCWWITGQAVP